MLSSLIIDRIIRETVSDPTLLKEEMKCYRLFRPKFSKVKRRFVFEIL